MIPSRLPSVAVPCLRWLAVFVAFALLSVSSDVQGQTEPSPRDHFERGVEATRQGDLVRALNHFEKAQALASNQTVLYNLAQTYSALGKPVEALRVLEQYLAADEPSGDSARRREVEELLRRNQGRVGGLDIRLEPTDASLEIDGVSTTVGSAEPMRIAAGRHLLIGTRAGYRPSVARVDVRAGELSSVRLVLESLSAERDAFIEPSCTTPEVTVLVDGIEVGLTPHAPLVPVSSGSHRVRFERRGYVPFEAPVVLNPKSVARVGCRLRVDPAGAGERADLQVLVQQPGARIRVDGDAFRRGRLPLGAHLVEVDAPGFRSFREVVRVRQGIRNEVRVSLEATAERQRADRASTRQIAAYTTGGVGLALGTVAAILYATNQGRYEDWTRDQRELSTRLAGGQARPDQARRAADLQERAASIQRTDDIALGAGFLGGVLLAVSVGLILSEEGATSPSRQNAVSHPLRFTW